MAQTFSFPFGDRYLSIFGFDLSFRIFTEENVYIPDPQSVRVEEVPGGVEVTADRLSWAGLQQSCEGRFRASFRELDDGLVCSVEAALPHRIKGTAIYLRGFPAGQIADRDFCLHDIPPQGAHFAYPNEMRLPVFLIRQDDGRWFAAASQQEEVSPKRIMAIPDGNGLRVELHHYEDARHWSCEHHTPAWQLVRTADPEPLLTARMEANERCWNLQPWETRTDVPAWAHQLGLVLNLHGEHWTGYLFNDYAAQLEILQYVCERIPGRHVLAFLPAWDGRYNYNWPQYMPNPRAGGAEGLRRLVAQAHELGVHVIPQIGAVSANRCFLPPALHDAGAQDAYGNIYVKEVDWDNDRQGDTYRVNANLGHPGFRRFLFDQTVRLTETFGFDGIFLDLNMRHHNDPRFSLVDGHRQFAAWCQERFDDFLIFGENWYDALLSAYPLVHSVTGPSRGYPQRWPQVFDRYARTTYHLIHPAPGEGSTGVYEAGYQEPWVPDPELNVIPAISFVHDTLPTYRQAVDERISAAKLYLKRQGIRT